jgi:hypothetical protein
MQSKLIYSHDACLPAGLRRGQIFKSTIGFSHILKRFG